MHLSVQVWGGREVMQSVSKIERSLQRATRGGREKLLCRERQWTSRSAQEQKSIEDLLLIVVAALQRVEDCGELQICPMSELVVGF